MQFIRRALIAAQATVILAAPVSQFPDPNEDAFYLAPADIANLNPGQVINHRAVNTVVTGNAVQSYQYLYRTSGRQNQAIATVGTVWIPGVPSSPPKIFSLQLPEDADNIDCSPSWAWVNKTSTQEAYFTGDNPILINWALSQGYYVVTPDFQGPDATWLVGLAEGRAVLDGIRGAIDFLGLCDVESALYGYSGGAHASSWASTLAASYAPELQIAGAAFGGTPVDLSITLDLISGTDKAALAIAAFGGLANGYPGFNTTLYSLLTAEGAAMISSLREPNHCTVSQGSKYANITVESLFEGHRNPQSNPDIARVLNQESLLANVNPSPVPVPQFPRFEWHGTGDTIVPYKPEAEYVSQQCAKGADIRFLTLPNLDHVPTYLIGIPGSLRFIQQAFDKQLESVKCGANLTVPSVGSQESIDIIGAVSDTALQALLAGL